ncbi:MAG: helix-turn-helix domain-containing protein [Pseudoxanthomonas sp.]
MPGAEDGSGRLAALSCLETEGERMPLLSLVPQAPLGRLVETIWDWEAAFHSHALERMLPVANAGLIINLAEEQTRVYDEQLRCTRFSASTLDGPRSRSSIIDTEEQVAVMGVIFRPGGAAVFFRERMDRIANDSVDLEDLVGNAAPLLREQLLEAPGPQARLALLCRWLERRMPPPASGGSIERALVALDADPRVAALSALAHDLGCSPRQLGERFRQQVGLTPKRYLRLRRFHRVLAATGGRERIDWAGLALDCGYHDQAHLAHEFREFSGLSPAAFTRRRGPLDQHIAVP